MLPQREAIDKSWCQFIARGTYLTKSYTTSTHLTKSYTTNDVFNNSNRKDDDI